MALWVLVGGKEKGIFTIKLYYTPSHFLASH
jgi:hypothetical protein